MDSILYLTIEIILLINTKEIIGFIDRERVIKIYFGFMYKFTPPEL